MRGSRTGVGGVGSGVGLGVGGGGYFSVPARGEYASSSWNLMQHF